MPPFSDNIFAEVLTYCAPPVAATFTLVSRHSAQLARNHLYARVALPFSRGIFLWRTLEEKPELGAMLRRLHLKPSPDDRAAQHAGQTFAHALSSMTGLRELYLDCDVDPSSLLQYMRAPLLAFRYAFLMPPDIYRFLYRQPTIRDLCLCRGIPYEIDPPPFLPNINVLHARPLDIEQLLRNRPVAEVHLRYRYYDIGFRPRTHLAFILESAVPVQQLHAMVCQFVDHADLFPYIPSVNHLVISADFSWGRDEPSPEYPQLMIDLCKKFINLVALQHLTIVTFFGNEAVRIFIDALRVHCRAPRLQEVVFHTEHRCLMWRHYRNPLTSQQTIEACPGHYVDDGSGLLHHAGYIKLDAAFTADDDRFETAASRAASSPQSVVDSFEFPE
ncbi:hypothetical protein B0H11DRAFT_2262022 [Mycena galericulata]|nr:hypothetical protein B0H11DRAFT_2262022 [Mycena galericulata]